MIGGDSVILWDYKSSGFMGFFIRWSHTELCRVQLMELLESGI